MDESAERLNQDDTAKENMEMYFDEHMAGGLDTKYLRDDVLEIFAIIEEC